MRSIKPGRAPSAIGTLRGVAMPFVGVMFTVVAFTVSGEDPGPIEIFVSIFGILFVLMGITSAAYNLYNATRRNRLSAFDITSPGEESDPLNQLVESGGDAQEESVESKLRELDELRRKGLVTDTEYAAQRQRILNTI